MTTLSASSVSSVSSVNKDVDMTESVSFNMDTFIASLNKEQFNDLFQAMKKKKEEQSLQNLYDDFDLDERYESAIKRLQVLSDTLDTDFSESDFTAKDWQTIQKYKLLMPDPDVDMHEHLGDEQCLKLCIELEELGQRMYKVKCEQQDLEEEVKCETCVASPYGMCFDCWFGHCGECRHCNEKKLINTSFCLSCNEINNTSSHYQEFCENVKAGRSCVKFDVQRKEN